MRKFLFTLLFTFISLFSVAQSKGDTVLYLVFEEDKGYKGEMSIYPMGEKMENVYWINKHLYDGYPLRFISLNRKDAVHTAIEELEKYPLVTIDELEQFIVDNYKTAYVGYYGGSYFKGLKHIYIVEKDTEKGTATITEVRLNIIIK